MSQAVPFPLVAVQLVANRQQSVSALLVRFCDPLPGCAAALFAEAELIELSRRIPCLVPPALAAMPALSELAAQGCLLAAEQPATGVDTPARFAELAEAGETRFAGAWYRQPPARQATGDAASRMLVLRLLKLLAEDAETDDIEALVKQDPRLSYQLLRLVNSVALGQRQHIASFRQAIVILGRRQLRRWLHLLMFARGQGGDGASLLLSSALLRARLLELTAAACGATVESREEAFMAGMFSLLDILLGMPLERIVEPLHLPADVDAALLERRGDLGTLLSMAEAAENGDTHALADALRVAGLSNRDFALCQFQACGWMLDTCREMTSV